jgi:hypothetical protein
VRKRAIENGRTLVGDPVRFRIQIECESDGTDPRLANHVSGVKMSRLVEKAVTKEQPKLGNGVLGSGGRYPRILGVGGVCFAGQVCELVDNS